MEMGRTSCTSFWANQFRVLKNSLRNLFRLRHILHDSKSNAQHKALVAVDNHSQCVVVSGNQLLHQRTVILTLELAPGKHPLPVSFG